MTPARGLRNLGLADLDAETLTLLVAHGEDLSVERKRQIPDAPKFGAAVASFANTLGGWLLLGVADDGAVVGFPRPSKLDLQSHLAQLLRKEVDPLPPFVADWKRVGDKEIAVVRVFESADAPHVLWDSGAIYVRTSQGKERVSSQAAVLALARRGEDSSLDAITRANRSDILSSAVGAMTRPGTVVPGDPYGKFVTATAQVAPFTVTPYFADWAITEERGPRYAERTARELGDLVQDGVTDNPTLQPMARGVIASHIHLIDPRLLQVHGAIAAVDSLGCIATLLRRRKPQVQLGEGLTLATLRSDYIRPVVAMAARGLDDAEAIGRSKISVAILIPTDVSLEGSKSGMLPTVRRVTVDREIETPATDDQLQELCREIEREVARTYGFPSWESLGS